MNSIVTENIQLTGEIRAKYPAQVQKSISQTVKYNDVRELKVPQSDSKEKADVEVIYGDSVETAYALQQKGLNPLILNMASDINPGGGWRKGSSAQEESLFYRSLYYLALEPRKREFYPLDLYNAIYTPDVFFFRSQDYNVLPYEECAFISCLAIAALRRPILTAEGKYTSHQRRITGEKIRAMFKIAILHGHDSVVLSAFGNGAFKNPPVETAEIFKEVVSEYRSQFKKIVFAILDYGPSKNFPIYKKQFQN